MSEDDSEAGVRQGWHAGAREVHHLEERLDLESLEIQPLEGGEPSLLARTSGHLLLWTIAIVVCYSAAL